MSALNEKLVINYELKEFDEKNQDEFLKFTKQLEKCRKTVTEFIQITASPSG